MGSLGRLCLLGLMTCLLCGIRLTIGSRTVGDPEMLAAGSTGLINTTAFEMTELGLTYCPVNPNRRFRTINGTCNNPLNKGSANMPLARLVLPPLYEAGTKGMPRTRGPSGATLPSPRTVSRSVHTDENLNQGLTVLFMQFGQFIDHDLGLTPMPTEGGRVIVCCGPGNVGLASPQPPECSPILFPAGDPDFKGDCMEFVRSDEAKENYGVAAEQKFREQLNAVTSFVDASMVYGSEDELAKELRTEKGTGAFLRVSKDRVQGDLLPTTLANCRLERPDDSCFLAGDIRVNEQPALATIHTIFLRLHNLIAERIQRARPGLSNEEVYQRARKLVGAITQNILYGEWLPILLGRKVMSLYGLNTGQKSSFVPSIDPTVLQEFSTAAYRFVKSSYVPSVDAILLQGFSTAAYRMGHSLVPNFLVAGSRVLRLRNFFLLPRVVREAFHDIAEGLVNNTVNVKNGELNRIEINQAKTRDQFIAGELSSHLFEVEPRRGLDLMSLNIQRGRDHGLPTYNQVRRACGFSPVTSFSSRVFNGTALRNANYANVDDIDLFPGGMSEQSPRDTVNGGILGPTFQCVIATQFFRLKYGDRFFFETNQRPEGFSRAQLNAIRNITMASVLCATTHTRMLPRNAFRVPSSSNPIGDCPQMRRTMDSCVDAITN
ncbi:hypothetical protein ACOMHN_053750 [Nucella lapillus]